jgi:hypothetical protein
MKVIITEKQYKKIICEGSSKNLSEKLDGLKNFFDEVNKECKKQMGFDLDALATWGVTISGLIGPVNQAIKGEFPELSNQNSILICVGILLTYYTSNKEKLHKVLQKIKEKELIFEFDTALSLTEKIKKTFISFMESLSLPIGKLANIMAYTFLIPIIPELYEIGNSGDYSSFEDVTKRVMAFVTMGYSGVAIKKILESIIQRFKNK